MSKLTKKQKEILAQFQDAAGDEKHHPQSHGFFARVKEFFEDLTE